jgi:hypothetical protein
MIFSVTLTLVALVLCLDQRAIAGNGAAKLLRDRLPTREPSRAKRIAGGAFAQRGDFPAQASILIHATANISNAYICAGVLVDRFWVLTAAHCCQRPPAEMDALVGTLVLENYTAPRIPFVEQYFPGPFNYTVNDLCVMKLATAADAGNPSPLDISPIGVIGQVTDFDDDAFFAAIAGFGRTIASVVTPSPLLKYSESIYRTNAYCESASSIWQNTSVLCSQEYAGMGVCDGDSGSGLISQLVR